MNTIQEIIKAIQQLQARMAELAAKVEVLETKRPEPTDDAEKKRTYTRRANSKD